MMFSNPKEIVQNLEIKEGDIIADFGAGVGRYAIPMSKKVKESGKIYALEVGDEVVDRLNSEITEAAVSHNVEVIKTNVETNIPQIEANSCDWVICANIFFTLEHKNDAINTIKNIIKRDGNVLVIDWTESFSGMGPASDHIFSEADAVELFKKNGFSLVKRVQAGSHHYGLVLSQENKKDEEDGENEEILSVEDID